MKTLVLVLYSVCLQQDVEEIYVLRWHGNDLWLVHEMKLTESTEQKLAINYCHETEFNKLSCFIGHQGFKIQAMFNLPMSTQRPSVRMTLHYKFTIKYMHVDGEIF